MSMLQLDERTQKQLILEQQQRMAQVQNGFHLMKENQARLERFRGVELQVAKLGVLERLAEDISTCTEALTVMSGTAETADSGECKNPECPIGCPASHAMLVPVD